MTVSFIFHGDLPGLLRKKYRSATRASVHYPLMRRTSIKDAIEALGVPHTEIACVIINNNEHHFESLLEDHANVMVFPPIPPFDVTMSTLLRPKPLPSIRFLADANVGKLARLLRMAGFDTIFDPKLEDGQLAEITCREQCVLLTRDISLLKHRKITFGRLVREQDPYRQFLEVITLFGLSQKIKPFSRCLLCNILLEPVDKESIVDRLKPLTRQYFKDFHICPACSRIYWPGSHRDKMVAFLGSLVDIDTKRNTMR
jgi:hypothetical protein